MVLSPALLGTMMTPAGVDFLGSAETPAEVLHAHSHAGSRSVSPSEPGLSSDPSSHDDGGSGGQSAQTALLLKTIQDQGAMLSRLALLLPPAAPPGPSTSSPSPRPHTGTPVVDLLKAVRKMDPRSEYPNYLPASWDARIHYKIHDGIRAAMPKKFSDMAKELASHRSANPWTISLVHTTPSGLLALADNDAKAANMKATRALEHGTPNTGPSATPLTDAAARMPSATWDKTKLTEYVLASVSHTLMLHTCVNPEFTAPALVMLQHVLTVAHGEHPGDWPQAVRVVDGEMKNLADPGLWTQQRAVFTADARRLTMDADKKGGAGPALDAQAQPNLVAPRLPSNLACYNWNHNRKCAGGDGGICLFTHKCTTCGGNHQVSHCPDRTDRDRPDRQRQYNNHRDGGGYRQGNGQDRHDRR